MNREICMQETICVGRIHKKLDLGPKTCFILINSGEKLALPSVCLGKVAINANKYLNEGDEISIEGKLKWFFLNEDLAKELLGKKEEGFFLFIEIRHISYGRKAGTIQFSFDN